MHSICFSVLHALASVAICLVVFVPNWGVWPLCSVVLRHGDTASAGVAYSPPAKKTRVGAIVSADRNLVLDSRVFF
jgi:hypothetical protein